MIELLCTKLFIPRPRKNLGVLAGEQGDHGRARSYYEESLALSRELGDKWGVALLLCNLAGIGC